MSSATTTTTKTTNTANDGYFQVRVMDWYRDSDGDQQAHLRSLQNAGRISHLDLRLTGWTIKKRRRIHVGSNTVPLILQAMMMRPPLSSSSSSLRELTIDLECLAQEKALIAFCNLLIYSSPSLLSMIRKVSIIASGEEDISNHALIRLGRSLQQFCYIGISLRLCGIKSNHLSTILVQLKTDSITQDGCCIITSQPIICTSRKWLNSSPRDCRGIFPKWCCNPYQRISSSANITNNHNNQCYLPSQLHLERIILSNDVLYHLLDLLLGTDRYNNNNNNSNHAALLSSTSTVPDVNLIQHLILQDCTQLAEDMDFLQLLLQGGTCLQELTLLRHSIESNQIPTHSYYWWQPPPHRAYTFLTGQSLCDRSRSLWQNILNRNHTTTTTSSSSTDSILVGNIPINQRLKRLRLTDCQGDDKSLQQITKSVASNTNMKRLVLTSSSSVHVGFLKWMIDALHTSMVLDNQPNNLLQLWILVGTSIASQRNNTTNSNNSHLIFESQQFHQLASIFRNDSNTCFIQDLLLDVGASPYHLDILADGITDHNNTSLQKLTIAGESSLDVTTLGYFVSMLEDGAPTIKWLNLRFPGIVDTDPQVLRIFQNNTTLERVELLSADESNSGGDSATTSSSFSTATTMLYYGLRNRIGAVLLNRGSWSNGSWSSVLSIILQWYNNTATAVAESTLDPWARELVVLSGIWFALTESPMMLNELEVMFLERQTTQ